MGCRVKAIAIWDPYPYIQELSMLLAMMTVQAQPGRSRTERSSGVGFMAPEGKGTPRGSTQWRPKAEIVWRTSKAQDSSCDSYRNGYCDSIKFEQSICCTCSFYSQWGGGIVEQGWKHAPCQGVSLSQQQSLSPQTKAPHPLILISGRSFRL